MSLKARVNRLAGRFPAKPASACAVFRGVLFGDRPISDLCDLSCPGWRGSGQEPCPRCPLAGRDPWHRVVGWDESEDLYASGWQVTDGSAEELERQPEPGDHP